MDKQALVERMKELSKDGRVACAQLLKLAAECGVSPRTVGELADELGLKITGCQLGCFG